MIRASAREAVQGRPWIEPVPVHIPSSLAAAVGGHPIVAATLARRGLSDPTFAAAFLDPERYQPAQATELPDLARAAERIAFAVDRGETILVWGDFDADGQTATTVLVSALRDIGGQVRYHIPDRSEGHGIHLARLTTFIGDGVKLIVTCDTGIGAHEAIAFAQGRYVDVVVTDHHDLTAGIPPSYAAVNPKLLDSSHPLRELPGVGCAYKLAEELYRRVGRPRETTAFLDLVAIGVVADVAVLTGDTRYLLQLGLERLRHTRRLGLLALMEKAHLAPAGLTESHIGFVVAPRLNSLGRMANAQVAVEFLTTADPARARILASQIEGLNSQRKLASDQVGEAAQAQIDRDPSLLDDPMLLLSHPAWPAGVIGIVAGRLAERYNRPAILLVTPPGQTAHGSARSVIGCSIVDALAANSGLMTGFGGHPMAAGLSIDAEHLPELRRALARTIREQCGELRPPPPVRVDAFVPLGDVSLEMVGEVNRLAPFGAGHPPLVLATRGLSITASRRVGRNGAHIQIAVEDEAGETRKVIWWGGADSELPKGRFDLAYTVQASDYRGSRDVQLEWVDSRVLTPPPGVLAAATPSVRVIDHRRAPDRRTVLRALRLQGDVQVWAEAGHRSEVSGRDRGELQAGHQLAIWTSPPGPRELRAAMDRVKPSVVHLFGVDPGLERTGAFLRRLAGLVKGALGAAQGARPRTTFGWLAAATAAREATVRAGLLWLVARGDVEVDADGDDIALSPGQGASSAEPHQIEAMVSALVAETAAYRSYAGRADAGALIGTPVRRPPD